MDARAITKRAAGVTNSNQKSASPRPNWKSSKVNISHASNTDRLEVKKQLWSLKRRACQSGAVIAEISDQMRSIVRQMLAGKARDFDAQADLVTPSKARRTELASYCTSPPVEREEDVEE